MVSTQMVHVRVKKEIKDEASSALESMGLSISDAVRALLTRIAVEHQIPFELKVPNRATREAMEEADALTTPRFHTATELFENLEDEDSSEEF